MLTSSIRLNAARLAAAQEQKDILNRAEAAAYLNMAPGTLTKYAKRGAIPCQKLARRVLFSRRALERWAACETAPIRETAAEVETMKETVEQ